MGLVPSEQPHGMFFEEFMVGQEIITAGRTITETDIIQFAGLSGDFNQIHMDAEFCQKTAIGQRVAHGLLVASVASGLAVQTGVLKGTVIVFREIAEWKFVKPILIGDTIHVELHVIETKPMHRTEGGLVTLKLEVINQKQEVANRGRWVVFVASRPLR
jgi:3-hydroxybutyryl-CoA dehydratase